MRFLFLLEQEINLIADYIVRVYIEWYTSFAASWRIVFAIFRKKTKKSESLTYIFYSLPFQSIFL